MTATRVYTDRRFLVARAGDEVVIREVCPGTSSLEFAREEAWDLANRLACRSRAHKESAMVFVGLDGAQRSLGHPKRSEREVERARTTPATEARTEATGPSELELVVADLREGRAAGRLNEWGASVLEQYERNGRLSEKQIAAGMRGVRAKQARAAERSESGGLPEVPAGRYAVESGGGELRFYRVNRARSGRTYIHVLHGPDESEVPFSWAGYRTILQSIVDAVPAQAAIRFGREIGRCSRCGIQLTNRLSRELGIGPICGGHWHEKDEWAAQKAAAREVIRARGEDPDEDVEELS